MNNKKQKQKNVKKSKRPIYIIFISILIALVIFIFFLPAFFSTKAGTNYLISKIEKKSNAKVEIESFHLTWFGPQRIKDLSYKDPNIDMNVDSITSNMSLLSFYKSIKTYKKLKLFANTEVDNLNVVIHYPNKPQANFNNVNASIKADLKGINSIEIEGKTTENKISGNFTAFIEFEGKKIQSTINGKNIPTIGIDQLLFSKSPKYQNLLSEILGSSLDLHVESTLDSLKGPIDIDIKSTNANASLNLFYEKDKITLTKSATIVLSLSPINPKFANNITYLASQKNSPIIIRISKDGFLYPISPFKTQNLKIGHMSVDLNKMLISNTGAIRTMTTLAKLRASNVVSMWFTNVNIQIENGMLFSDRMDFLIDEAVHLCTWGKIDLNNRALKMNLGITADTLYSVFGIQNLPDDYVIKIPIKGTIDNPKIDASKATAKIIALSTLQQSSGIGSIIGGIITKFQKDQDIPPAKRPFPWEGKVRRRAPARVDTILDFFK
ncbi:MAG: hypothetical protein KR126chlam4_01329 [Candidatus Anoxychlamydiales bacterium]|nr:hypothetical protein [Candidatus Anoxychlamydiales bacterium]